MTRKVTYSMGVSLDGFVADAQGEIDWTAPDEELHRFHNEQMREVGVHLCGRRLYETMVYWETAEQNPASTDVELEFARIWQALPKIVFSTMLEAVEGNATLAREGLAEEIARLKQEAGGDIAVGGAGLAAAATRLRLIDEYGLFVSPAVLGGGTPFFPSLEQRLGLELLETRTFGSRVVYLRYQSAARGGMTGRARGLVPAAGR